MSFENTKKDKHKIQNPERRSVLSKGLKALATIGVASVAIGFSERGALAGTCKNCNGTTTSCSATPTCGVQ